VGIAKPILPLLAMVVGVTQVLSFATTLSYF
jgi:hypothetical protein